MSQKRMDMLTYASVEYKYLETLESLAKTFIIPVSQNQFIQENIFNKAPIRRVAFAMNAKSAFTVFFSLKTRSGINILISDKIEYSEGDSQL